MNRRQFLRHHAVLAATAGFAPRWGSAAETPGARATPAATPASVHSRLVPSLTIRDYLAREARRITDGALGEFSTAADWRRLLPEKRQQWLEMIGLEAVPPSAQREPPEATITGVLERPGYRIEKLHYQSLPRLHVTANLYVPERRNGRAPAVLYVCGHSKNQKAHYQAHPRRFAELGCVCLIVETVQLGEVEGFHHGCYREGWWHWYSRGYTAAGIETFNGLRALDYLATRPEVDPARMGVTGISGGGAVSWWLAATDERVQVAAPVCGTATLFSHIHDRTIDGHCDCMWWNNHHRWDLADVGALIAPRPLLIASADRDGIFTIESIRRVHGQLAALYAKLEAAPRLRLVETPGGHSYHARSRTAIFSWFLRHLAGREVPPEAVGDLDDRPERQESVESLRVYVAGAPAGHRVATIQDEFLPAPTPPPVTDGASLEAVRTRVVRELRRRTFGAFPSDPPPLDVQVEYEEDEGSLGQRFAFTSEEGWRLHGRVRRNKSLPDVVPAVLALRSPDEGRWDTRGFLDRIRAPWAKVEIAPRGTDDTAWGAELAWHIRRAAAWTGRTIASMRVWDTLRALHALRTWPGVDGRRLALAARGEMCAVALYAALLDGGVTTLFLESPPATQDAASAKDGRGPALEMLGCLRVTDLPYVAGLLWPCALVLAGEVPARYEWAQTLYRTLGEPGRCQRVADVGAWNPA